MTRNIYALLVGIDNYPNVKALKGCINDVDHNPRSDNYTVDRFEITSYIRVGSNQLTITLGDATTHYWIKWLKLFINLPDIL